MLKIIISLPFLFLLVFMFFFCYGRSYGMGRWGCR